MLIADQPRFVFLHVDKTAGSSIRTALQPWARVNRDCPIGRRLWWLGPLCRLGGLHRRLVYPEHIRALALRRCLPRADWAGSFKFAFVRNPWDRLVSRYEFLRRHRGHRHHARVIGFADFGQYLAWEIGRGNQVQHPFLTDPRGVVLVDFVGRFERLATDFAAICARLQINAQLPHHNRSPHRPYPDYYTPAWRDLVAHHARRDCELFGYQFAA